MFEKTKNMAEKLVENLPKRGLYYEIKEIINHKNIPHPHDGIYILF